MKLLDKMETINKLNTLMDTHYPFKLDIDSIFSFYDGKKPCNYSFVIEGPHGIYDEPMYAFLRKNKSSSSIYPLHLINYEDGNYLMVLNYTQVFYWVDRSKETYTLPYPNKLKEDIIEYLKSIPKSSVEGK